LLEKSCFSKLNRRLKNPRAFTPGSVNGHKWDDSEIQRRIERVNGKGNKTLVKNIPYGSGLAGGVRNEKWYQRNRNNTLDYEKWCFEWSEQLFRICKPGATVLVFNSTRTVAHVQVALESAGF